MPRWKKNLICFFDWSLVLSTRTCRLAGPFRRASTNDIPRACGRSNYHPCGTAFSPGCVTSKKTNFAMPFLSRGAGRRNRQGSLAAVIAIEQLKHLPAATHFMAGALNSLPILPPLRPKVPRPRRIRDWSTPTSLAPVAGTVRTECRPWASSRTRPYLSTLLPRAMSWIVLWRTFAEQRSSKASRRAGLVISFSLPVPAITGDGTCLPPCKRSRLLPVERSGRKLLRSLRVPSVHPRRSASLAPATSWHPSGS